MLVSGGFCQQIRKVLRQKHPETSILSHAQTETNCRLCFRQCMHKISECTENFCLCNTDRKCFDPIKQVTLCGTGMCSHRQIVLMRDLLWPRPRVEVSIFAAVRDNRDCRFRIR